jgi:tripeptide aminopeptidase
MACSATAARPFWAADDTRWPWRRSYTPRSFCKVRRDRFPHLRASFFTFCEEQGLVGAKHMGDVLRQPVRRGVSTPVGPVGGITHKAPSQNAIYAAFRGQAAHAGVEPERGRSAIHGAAKAIAAMQLGRLDEETSANIGVIHGGVASNIVPECCEIRGECRRHDDEKLARVAAAMVEACSQEGATHAAWMWTSAALTSTGPSH